ncbi:hypothetical protein MSPP1_003293 [Malassezia sp. CBS 17886]|nr:hypothetical protein MSPP1_003293 [Malassezia sp. CBS 17886]
MPVARKTGNRLGLAGTKSRATGVRDAAKAAGTKAHVHKTPLRKGEGRAAAVDAATPSTSPPRDDTEYPKDLLAMAAGRPHLDPSAYDALWRDTQKRMGIPPSTVPRIEQILRVFDLNPTYGPCMGLRRLERWERAKDIGEDPPEAIAEILRTREGVLDLRTSILDQAM